jgi:thiosulfate/3-mercaptopyruvate sulfurtransferase
MIWKINSVLLLFILTACLQGNDNKVEETSLSAQIAQSKYLIETTELLTKIKQPNIKILDFRKQKLYEQEHIAGALHIWRDDIENSSYPYKGMMASKQQIESLFCKLGITLADTLIVYDDKGLSDSARLWWLLQNYDFINVKLLNGGFADWKANNGPVTTQWPMIKTSVFTLPENPSMKYYVSKKEMQEGLDRAIILDTRSLNEYSGKEQKSGAKKAGRIPNSIHIDWAEAIDYHGNKKLKPIETLSSIYSQMSVGRDRPIWVYCHSGVRSAHTTFVLTQLLDYQNVKNYDGSWTEWSYFDELEFEKDI